MATQQQNLQPRGQERALPVSRDIIYAAMKQYPGYDQQTALSLYLIDQNFQQQQTDADQTRLIQAQKNQNDKLTNAVKSIGQEINDLEQQSIETDREIERIKSLSARLKPSGEIQQELIKATSEELKDLENQIKLLKSKPGIDNEKYQELTKQIKQISSNKAVDSETVKKVENMISALEGKQSVSDDLYNKVLGELEKTQADLEGKEERFSKYIDKKKGEIGGIKTQSRKEIEAFAKSSATEIKKYAEIVSQYKKEIDRLRPEFETAKKAKDDILAMRQEVAQELESLKGEQNVLDIKRGLPRATPPQAAAADATGNAIKKMRTAPQIPSDLASNIERRSELDRRYSMTTNPEEYLNEDVRPAHRYPNDPEYGKWIEANLPILVKMFKHQYWYALEKKDPTYSDTQIAYIIEEFAPWLWNHETDVLTQEIMDKFLSAVKTELWKQPPEPEQTEFDFKESLSKVYENMLDQIINKSLQKRR